MFALELLDEMIDHPIVEVLTAQVGVSSCGLHLKDAILNGQDGNIKGSTTEVKDEDIIFLSCATCVLLVKAVGDGCGGGFVDDPEDVEASDDTSIFCGLALRIVEVGRNWKKISNKITSDVNLYISTQVQEITTHRLLSKD